MNQAQTGDISKIFELDRVWKQPATLRAIAEGSLEYTLSRLTELFLAHHLTDFWKRGLKREPEAIERIWLRLTHALPAGQAERIMLLDNDPTPAAYSRKLVILKRDGVVELCKPPSIYRELPIPDDPVWWLVPETNEAHGEDKQ